MVGQLFQIWAGRAAAGIICMLKKDFYLLRLLNRLPGDNDNEKNLHTFNLIIW